MRGGLFGCAVIGMGCGGIGARGGGGLRRKKTMGKSKPAPTILLPSVNIFRDQDKRGFDHDFDIEPQ